MTAAQQPPTDPAPPTVCGYRERKDSGLHECVRWPGHTEAHYLVRLVRYVGAAS